MPVTIHNPVEAVLKTAHEFLGVREEGSNRGPFPDFSGWFQGRDWRDYPMGMKGAPWCATGAIMVIRLALGWACPIPIGAKYSDVDELAAWAKNLNIWHDEPEKGDIGCIERGGGYGHAVIVTEPQGEFYRSWEANSNQDGSFNGDGVYERRRTVAGSGFIRWMELLS